MALSHWSNALTAAADSLEGGLRSFPPSCDDRFKRAYAYDTSNERYQRLFFEQATVPSSPLGASARSAGWLISNGRSDCNPVLIANSLLAAVWVIRESLPSSTLSDEGWSRLVSGAEALAQGAQDSQEEPPSAQKPRDSTSFSTKRPTPSLETPNPKRGRTAPSPEYHFSSVNASPESSGGIMEEGVLEQAVLTTTITNHNRKADLARTKKREVQAQRRRTQMGLVPPKQNCTALEMAAYDSISPSDEEIFAWILKQRLSRDEDFYLSVKSPYTTAKAMVEKARALGSESALNHAAYFLQSWRSQGTPFPNSGHFANASQSNAIITPQAVSQASLIDDAFQHAWNHVSRCEGQLAAVHIQYRWAMAFLGRAYENKIAEIKAKDLAKDNDRTRNRYGGGKVQSEATEALLPLVYKSSTKRKRDIFQKRLHRASRFYEAASVLGWGFLCLIPHNVVPNSWVEQTLRIGELRLWLELVKRVNPEVHSASTALEAWLGSECIAGGPLRQQETLRIEVETPAIVYEVEEVQDSEDEEQPALIQSQSTQQSTQCTRPLRQLTLLDWFAPR
ncbi:MAG: hypothetical protein L6R40_008617 [Gallowayella cf. fulva]|nr:MAG: hypothetical protein L6R40_008617 [Xanthomendoza cf. fulva]